VPVLGMFGVGPVELMIVGLVFLLLLRGHLPNISDRSRRRQGPLSLDEPRAWSDLLPYIGKLAIAVLVGALVGLVVHSLLTK
jgi:hypothetical protein